MNPFQIIPPKVRTALYLVYGLVALATTAGAAYCGAIGEPVPGWLIGVGAALVPIGSAFGFTAASNVTQAQTVALTAPATVEVSVPDEQPPAGGW